MNSPPTGGEFMRVQGRQAFAAASGPPYFSDVTLPQDSDLRRVPQRHAVSMLKLDHIRVADVMHAGILSCAAESTLRDVAAIMSRHHVHAVAITDDDGGRLHGIVSDLDIMDAIASGAKITAGQTAASELLAVSSAERLVAAAQLMSEHGVSHLVVADAADGHPVGVLSTLDIAAVYGQGALD